MSFVLTLFALFFLFIAAHNILGNTLDGTPSEYRNDWHLISAHLAIKYWFFINNQLTMTKLPKDLDKYNTSFNYYKFHKTVQKQSVPLLRCNKLYKQKIIGDVIVQKQEDNLVQL